MTRYVAGITLFLILISGGCIPADTPAYLKFEEIPNDGWPQDYALEFTPCPDDSCGLAGENYQMTLILRTPARHTLSSLPLVVTYDDDKGTLAEDTIVLKPESKEMSKHREYGVCEYEITLRDKLRLSPGFTVTLTPLADETKSSGLLNVGLRLDQCN